MMKYLCEAKILPNENILSLCFSEYFIFYHIQNTYPYGFFNLFLSFSKNKILPYKKG